MFPDLSLGYPLDALLRLMARLGLTDLVQDRQLTPAAFGLFCVPPGPTEISSWAVMEFHFTIL